MVAIVVTEDAIMTTIQVTPQLKKQLDQIGGKLQSRNGQRRTYEQIIQELIRVWEKTKEVRS